MYGKSIQTTRVSVQQELRRSFITVEVSLTHSTQHLEGKHNRKKMFRLFSSTVNICYTHTHWCPMMRSLIIRWNSQLLIGPGICVRPWKMTLGEEAQFTPYSVRARTCMCVGERLTRTASELCQECHRIQNHMKPLRSSERNFWCLVIWGGWRYWGTMCGPPPALIHTHTRGYSTLMVMCILHHSVRSCWLVLSDSSADLYQSTGPDTLLFLFSPSGVSP